MKNRDFKKALPTLKTAAEARELLKKDANWKEDADTLAMNTALYTSSTSGQAKEGTFSPKGLKQFRKFAKGILRNRKKNKEQILTFDKEMMEILRKSKGITGETYEDDLKSGSRKRKPGDKPTIAKKKIKLWDINDEDADLSDSDATTGSGNHDDE